MSFKIMISRSFTPYVFIAILCTRIITKNDVLE